MSWSKSSMRISLLGGDGGPFGSGFLLGSSLLLLKILGEDLLVGLSILLADLPSLLLGSLQDGLSSESGGSDESLHVWWLVSGLLANFDFSSNNILSWVILLSEGEGLSDVADSLWSKSSWSGSISESCYLCVSLNENLECNDSKVWSTDTSSSWLSLSLSRSSWSVEGGSYIVKIDREYI